MIGQFTRWLCPKCGEDGIDSWNKAAFDGTGALFDEIPNPLIFGTDCMRCCWPCVVRYGGQDEAPRAIFGHCQDCGYSYEAEAFEQIEGEGAGVVLAPAGTMDADWSGGCLAAKGQLQ